MGDARPPPFTISTTKYKVVVYAPPEGADTLPLFLRYPYMYSVDTSINNKREEMLSAVTSVTDTSEDTWGEELFTS
jgi:hypothetical protein